MSLINQVLQDLDRRRDGEPLLAEYTQVHAVPTVRAQRQPLWWLLAGICAIVLLALGWWFGLRHTVVPVPNLSKADNSVVVARPVAPLQAATAAATVAPTMVHSIEPASAPASISSINEAPAVATKDVVPAAVPDQTPQMPSSQVKPLISGVTHASTPTPTPLVQPDMPVARTEPVALPRSERARVEATPHVGVETAPATPALLGLSKHVQALSSSQQAENAYRRAVASFQQGDAAAARQGLEQALQLDPRHAAARQTLAGLLLDAKQEPAAIELLQAGLRLDSAQPGMAMILARIQVDGNDLDGALKTLRKTLPAALDRADYQSFLAALLQRQGAHAEAIDHYQRALQMAPQNALWWMGLGISLRATSRFVDAEHAFDQAAGAGTLTPQLQAFVDQQRQQIRPLRELQQGNQ